GGREDTLDFVGTGGALERMMNAECRMQNAEQDIIESNWARERYDLSFVSVGETIQVKLSFKSDRDTVDEGFYIDDVQVTGGQAPVVGVVLQSPEPARLRLSVQPNPFRRTTVVLGGSGAVAVYDAAGREVNLLTVVNGQAVWDGRDRSGKPLPAGAYFVRPAGAGELARVVLVR
ncbi:MAG: FlgD immunoglobulin-like domain containing protein, partial [candidate division WOR-3 bacterium]